MNYILQKTFKQKIFKYKWFSQKIYSKIETKLESLSWIHEHL